jgi:hypothetical protein
MKDMKLIKRNILKALESCDGVPMPENSLVTAVQLLGRPMLATRGDIKAGVEALELEDFIAGVSDSIIGTSWTLTLKGIHKARQL